MKSHYCFSCCHKRRHSRGWCRVIAIGTTNKFGTYCVCMSIVPTLCSTTASHSPIASTASNGDITTWHNQHDCNHTVLTWSPLPDQARAPAQKVSLKKVQNITWSIALRYSCCLVNDYQCCSPWGLARGASGWCSAPFASASLSLFLHSISDSACVLMPDSKKHM